jgi:hypothetical protein
MIAKAVCGFLAELQNFDLRWSSETRYGIYGTRDTIVHLEDEIGLVNFQRDSILEEPGNLI